MPPTCGWFLTATPWIAFACNVISNLLILRTRRHLSIVSSLLYSFLVGCLAFGVAASSYWPQAFVSDTGFRLTAGFLTYACASYFFFHVVHIPVASVRIRVLQELVAHGPLTESEILQHYDARSILDIRLDRLTRSRQLRLDDGRYFTGRRRMLYVARFFAFAKRVVLGARK